MIAAPTGTRIVLVAEPVDFRKGPDSLARWVAGYLGENAFAGAVYIFRSRRADRIKILGHDGTGLWLYQKRLEIGGFVWPKRSAGRVQLSPAQLAALLEGGNWRRVGPVRWHRPQRAA